MLAFVAFLFVNSHLVDVLGYPSTFARNYYALTRYCKNGENLKKSSGKGFGKPKISDNSNLIESENFNPDPSSPQESVENNSEIIPDIDERIKLSNLYKTIKTKRDTELEDKVTRLREEQELIASDVSVGSRFLI